jgi:hypothetical protein
MPLSLQAETPAALVCGVMADSEGAVLDACSRLEKTFGAMTDRSAVYDFEAFSAYYRSEMGVGLQKCFACFGDPVMPSSLAAAKLDALKVEREVARQIDGHWHRTINVDPGLVSANSLILATTKASGHRIAIAPSLFAEVTLLFEKGEYRPLPWSYRDVQSDPVQTLLIRLRQRLLS